MRILPVYLVAGFLGSGKSSLLEHLITAPDYPRESTALIINDAGPLNVDAKLFRGKAARIAALTGGCACCVTPRELINQLLQYAADDKIQQVWLEASGVADTEDLLDCLTNAELLGKISLHQIIYVVDAENFPRWFVNRWVQEDRVKWADVVVINKIDRITPKKLDAIRDQVRVWNKGCRILTSQFGRVALPAGQVEERDLSSLAAGHLPATVKAFFVPMHGSVVREKLESVLETLPAGVCRVKGFVRFSQQPTQLQVVHKVGDSRMTVWQYEGEAETGLVVLGLDLDARLLQQTLKQLTQDSM